MRKFQYKHYLLILLTAIAVFNLLDRYVLSLVMEPLKQEFQLSDSDLGILSGFAFAFFYAVAGIPIARWADRGNRNTIVSLTTGMWSVLVVLFGMVGNFTQLLAVRVGVAVGEAGCMPPAQSLIADYYNRAERPHAMAIYWSCGPLAIIVGYLGGGWLVEYLGWRFTFLVIGVPGIFLALLARFTLREPRLEQEHRLVKQPPSLKVVLKTLWHQRAFQSIVIAFCVGYFFSAGIGQWMPTFFMRSHGMGAGELGTWLAFVWGGFGLIGIYLGGILVARYAANKEPLQMKACAFFYGIAGLLYMMMFLTSELYHALGYMAAAQIMISVCNGAIFSAIQTLVNQHMRSVALAFIFLLANLIGLGLGPVAIGFLSDLLNPTLELESLRYALAAFCPGLIFVSVYFWKASDTIEADIHCVESQSEKENAHSCASI